MGLSDQSRAGCPNFKFMLKVEWYNEEVLEQLRDLMLFEKYGIARPLPSSYKGVKWRTMNIDPLGTRRTVQFFHYNSSLR